MLDSWILPSILIVLTVAFTSVVLLWIVRSRVSAKILKSHHDVAGFTFSIIGVLYSVILGFTVINEQERYNAADEAIHTEVTMLIDLARDAGIFPKENRDAIRKSLREYVDFVIHEEWGRGSIQLQAQNILMKIWKEYYAVDLGDEKEKVWYQQSISKLDKLMDARLAREYGSWQRLDGMMWSLLIVGAAITVCFMFFFGIENVKMQMLMTALLSGYLAFMLFLVFTLDHVFTGVGRIKPTAFEKVIPVLEQYRS